MRYYYMQYRSIYDCYMHHCYASYYMRPAATEGQSLVAAADACDLWEPPPQFS